MNTPGQVRIAALIAAAVTTFFVFECVALLGLPVIGADMQAALVNVKPSIKP